MHSIMTLPARDFKDPPQMFYLKVGARDITQQSVAEAVTMSEMQWLELFFNYQ